MAKENSSSEEEKKKKEQKDKRDKAIKNAASLLDLIKLFIQ